MWSAVTTSPLWVRAERDKERSQILSATVDWVTRSALAESGDSIAALQNRVIAKNRKCLGPYQVSRNERRRRE